jgi:nucleotide-binding universal stress UspA family protein
VRVLIATDGSPGAIGAARTALTVLAPPDHIGVLSVVDVRAEVALGGSGLIGAEPLTMPLADPTTAAELDDALMADARAAIDETIAAMGAPAAAAERLVRHGDPATEICRVAAEGGYDVVVVGSHGSGLVKRVLVGSVSHHVIQHAPCPVLVVRERRDRRERPEG